MVSTSKMADAEQNFCDFSQNSAVKCGSHPAYRDEKDYIRLRKCNKEIKRHLNSVQVSQTALKTEMELIAYRCGYFDVESPVLQNKIICSMHRYKLGLKWNRPRGCCHPLHGRSQGRTYRGIGPEMSKDIMMKWNTFVAIGSGKK